MKQELPPEQKPPQDPAAGAPEILYKYRAWDQYARRMLEQNELFFSSVAGFNDPFDGAIPARYDLCSEAFLIASAERHLRSLNPCMDSKELRVESKQLVKDRMRQPEQFWSEHRNEQRRILESHCGIVSFSAKFDSLLMWAHYSYYHRGLCVGVESTNLVDFADRSVSQRCAVIIRPVRVVGLYKVVYQNEYPVLVPDNFPREEMAIKELTPKSREWKYEEEYRLLLVGTTNIAVSLPDGVIREVVLGCKMCEEHKQEVRAILAGKRDCGIRLLQAEMKPDAFGLDFREVDY